MIDRILYKVADNKELLYNTYLKATASRGRNREQRLKAQVSQLYFLFCKSLKIYKLAEP